MAIWIIHTTTTWAPEYPTDYQFGIWECLGGTRDL